MLLRRGQDAIRPSPSSIQALAGSRNQRLFGLDLSKRAWQRALFIRYLLASLPGTRTQDSSIRGVYGVRIVGCR
jgi:hypothetical protein